MRYWVKPDFNEEKQRKLSAAWADFKKHGQRDTLGDTDSDSKGITVGLIDLNAADSTTLISLNGIGPVTAHKIIQRRKMAGPFKNFDELLEIRHFPKAVFAALKQQLKPLP